MAASSTEPPCRLCHGILPKKQRRTIFGDTFGVLNQLVAIIGYMPHPNDQQGKYICGLCWNKLNKLCKIEHDINTRLEALKTERHALIAMLREKYTQSGGQPLVVGTPKSRKHLIVHSPTPRKVKRSLNLTPQRSTQPTGVSKLQKEAMDTEDQEKEHQQATSVGAVKKKINIQLFSPDKIKILYRGHLTKMKSKIIPGGDFQNIIRSIMTGQSNKKIGHVIYHSQLREAVLNCVVKELKNELMHLSSTKRLSCLRKTSSDDLATYSFNSWNLELQLNAPVMYKIISSFYEKCSPNAVAVTAAIILKQKNMHMSAFHHAVSQILDNGGATDECINLLNKLGLCVSASATAKKKVDLMARQEKHVDQLVLAEKKSLEEKIGEDTILSSDIVGDNFDISKSPSHMSKEKQRKSWHWFMLVGLQKRVLNHKLENQVPGTSIKEVENAVFIPSIADCKSLENNFIFHIMKVLVKYVTCFRKYEPYIPKYIEHPHIQEMSNKSDFVILELLDKSENKSEDMISILEHIHSNYIPHTAEDHPHVIRKKVFGGDVLTNERAYSAQLAMLNGATDFEQISGVIHRPEGLHRMMNLCLIIYQQFYKASSAIDRGTLYQLRNIVHRVDVQGSERVIDSYRAHCAFINDCLDAFIVGACLHHLSMEDMDSEPRFKQVLFDAVSSEDKKQFIEKIASDILKKYINLENDLHTLEIRSQELDLQEQQIQDMFDASDGKYSCVHCRRSYKTQGHLKNHLSKEHGWQFHKYDQNEDVANMKLDRVALYRASFMKCSLLLRDTNDAYSMGDGNRIMDNAKFQMLLSGIGHHTKYQLWLFRFLANFHCLLSPQEAYEYKWNCTTNLKGGTGHNIPNDNLVEILVHRLKAKLQAQGANVTHASARKAALTLQIQDEIKENMIEQCGMKKTGTSRTSTSVTNDIVIMLNELAIENVFDHVPGRQYENFRNFNDLFSKLKIMELHKWLTKQKDRLSYETI